MAFPFAADQLYAPASSKGEVAGLYRGRSASGKPEVPRPSSASTRELVTYVLRRRRSQQSPPKAQNELRCSKPVAYSWYHFLKQVAFPGG